MRLSVLIVDDEPHARRHIKSLLDKDPEIEVVHECKNGKEVLKFIKNKEPSIIFLDINMPGPTGVEIAAELQSRESLIIFSTAYGEYALEAFELEAFDYLLKPFEDSRFYEVLERAKDAIEKNRQAAFGQKFAELYEVYSNTMVPHITEFVIKDKGFEHKIHVDDVLYIEASAVYAALHLKSRTLLYRTALNLLEQQLPSNFLRVHRSFIVNRNYVSDVKYLNNSTYMLTMENDDVIISSRKYKESISNAWS